RREPLETAAGRTEEVRHRLGEVPREPGAVCNTCTGRASRAVHAGADLAARRRRHARRLLALARPLAPGSVSRWQRIRLVRAAARPGSDSRGHRLLSYGPEPQLRRLHQWPALADVADADLADVSSADGRSSRDKPAWPLGGRDLSGLFRVFRELSALESLA